MLELEPRFSFRVYTLYYSSLPGWNTVMTGNLINTPKGRKLYVLQRSAYSLTKTKICVYVKLVKNDIWG